MFIKEGKKNPRQPHMWNLFTYALPSDAVQQLCTNINTNDKAFLNPKTSLN
jgi:hypothetical protein